MKIKFIVILVAISIIIASCKSAPPTPPIVPNFTPQKQEIKKPFLMNTSYTNDEEIYSCLLFKELTSVTATVLTSKRQIEIPLEYIYYDPENTQLLIADEFPLPKNELVFHIEGIPFEPIFFVFNDIKGEPYVVLYKNKIGSKEREARTAVEGVDYKFFREKNCISFIYYPLESNADSFMIFCEDEYGAKQTVNSNDMRSFSNDQTGKFLPILLDSK